jgi:hypothetical protein
MIGLIDRATRKMKWEHRDDSWGMQHDCEPLPNGNITLFANGTNITTNPFSRAIEFDPRSGKSVWESHISGVQRLASGNTLGKRMCSSAFRDRSAKDSGDGCSKSRPRVKSSGNT